MTLQYTSPSAIPKIVADLRASFRTHHTHSLEFRKGQLRALQHGLEEFHDEFAVAFEADLHRSSDMDVSKVEHTIQGTLDKLDEMTADQETSGLNEFDKSFVHLSPLGTVLVIGAWNFPVLLTLGPLIGALASGNTCVVKPSEVSEHSSAALTRMLVKFMDPTVVQVVNGGPEETTVLLKERFDHIFYTGNTLVGKIVMEAASKHLTPVTLELGGKCPAFITENTDIAAAAQRIAYWKTWNTGQVCLAVDYVLCPKNLQEALIKNVIGTWHELFGKDFRNSDSYGRIVSKKQFDRISKLLVAAEEQNKIVFGGKSEAGNLYVEPTIVTKVTERDELMQSELFAPILPIITYETFDEALNIINGQEHPLSVNLFSDNQDQINRVLKETRSGAVNVNDIAASVTNESLPFGGVGHSGMGSYHGKYSIETFSHPRSVMIRNQAHL
ncbi:Aldehyde dehydrogenase, dimeric NADP-preferring [Dissophora globulifera]|uniref:Aldehyde dehydrogenase n=1 Tax=Dissophora globulifera TaxID=979702 RepID=A0A9P6RCZ5_9FUNG|nr:Aldehyde dehydrogenase, dimeric NADP-preferring [Dissophora globulifera]